MLSLFTKVKTVFIYGHSDEAVKYAQMLDDVKQIYYFSIKPIDIKSLETLRKLPNVQIYEKNLPVELLTSSELLIVASEDDGLNVDVIDKAAADVPLIAAEHSYAGVNVVLGEKLRDEVEPLVMSSKLNGYLLKNLSQFEKEDKNNLTPLKVILDLLEETKEHYSFTEAELEEIYKMNPWEQKDWSDKMMENYLQNCPDYHLLYFSGDFEKKQAKELAREFEEHLRSEGFEQNVIIEEIENPYDKESNEEFHQRLLFSLPQISLNFMPATTLELLLKNR